MSDFFKGRNFKVLVLLLVMLFGFMIRASMEGTSEILTSKIISTITTPFNSVGAGINNSVGGFFGSIFNASKISEENEQLKSELASLTNQLVEFERYKQENEQLKEFLELKEENSDFELMPANVIGRNTEESFYGFTINKGTAQGVAVGDPVVSGLGLVGIIEEVSYSSAKVTTILSPVLQTGVLESVTAEIGIVTGTIELSIEGKSKLTYLPRDSAASVGDIVVTSGVGGVFPKDIVVGEITAIFPESHGLSLYAELTPLDDIRTIKNVSVITSFDGQGEE